MLINVLEAAKQTIAAQVLALNLFVIFTFEPLSQTELFSTTSFSCILVFASSSFVWIFQLDKLNILELL